MGNEGPGVLGAWEDRPLRRFDVDLTKARLDARSAFVLTRIDGQTSIAELCEMSGLGETETLRVLGHLRSTNLIEITEVGPRPAAGKGARVPAAPIPSVATPTPIPRARRATPPPTRRRRTEIPARFGGPDARQLAALRNIGPLGHVPDVPFNQPGIKQYEGIEFDKRKLLERSSLSIDQKREILFLHDHRTLLDHYEYLGIEPTVDRKTLKGAYFELSKKFHPDSFFRKEMGAYGAMVQEIYRHGTAVYEALSSDEGLRLTYYQVIQARNAAFKAMLEAERAALEAERAKRAEEQAAEERRQAAIRRERTEQRKDALQSRLEARKQTRRDRAPDPVQERLDRAARFYSDGMEQYQSGKFLEAANAIKLAVSFDPRNEVYIKAYERVAEKAAILRHDRLWQRGHFAESIGQRTEAIAIYAEAVGHYPRPDHCAHLAEMMLDEGEDLHRAVELAQIACDADGENVDYLVLLAQIYEKVDLVKKGIATYQRVIELDPKHENAKKALRALKRK